jgi:hypothetical protein
MPLFIPAYFLNFSCQQWSTSTASFKEGFDCPLLAFQSRQAFPLASSRWHQLHNFPQLPSAAHSCMVPSLVCLRVRLRLQPSGRHESGILQPCLPAMPAAMPAMPAAVQFDGIRDGYLAQIGPVLTIAKAGFLIMAVTYQSQSNCFTKSNTVTFSS